MKRLNFSDNIQAGGREFHLQTSTDVNKRIDITLFESGKVLARNSFLTDQKDEGQKFYSIVLKKHRHIISAIDRLYALLEDIHHIHQHPILLQMVTFFIRWQLWKESIIVLDRLKSIEKELYPNSYKDIVSLIRCCESSSVLESVRQLNHIKNKINLC